MPDNIGHEHVRDAAAIRVRRSFALRRPGVMRMVEFCGGSTIVSTALLVAAASFGQLTPALALEPAWPPGPYKYVVIEQDLKEVFTEFGRNINVPVKVSDEVKGRVRGKLPAGTAEQFIKRLSEANGLIWYFDGATLHVNAAAEVRTEV